jgi:hypothetical protein
MIVPCCAKLPSTALLQGCVPFLTPGGLGLPPSTFRKGVKPQRSFPKSVPPSFAPSGGLDWSIMCAETCPSFQLECSGMFGS